MAVTKDKKKDPDRLVVAWQSFATPDRVVHTGEKVRASDPIVGDGRWFDEVDAPDSERTNFWDQLPPPPDHNPAVQVQSIGIPPHRQVRSMVNVARPAQWAPDSAGASSGRPAPFFHSTLAQGQILDVLDPRVRTNPGWFRFIERDVTAADIERLEREARLEEAKNGAAA